MTYESESGDIRIALAGEAMITRGLMAFHEDRFLALRDLLHTADARFANSEMLFHNFEDWPTYLSQTYMRCDPRFIADLQWLGINLVSCANNHGYDYGENGVLTNLRNLSSAGLIHAGSGKHYAEAVAPAYLETPAGRVALVSATSSARPNSRAGEQRRDMNGRPGVNLVRWINEWTIDASAFAEVQRVAQSFGWRQQQPSWFNSGYGFGAESPDDVVYFADRNVLGVGSEDLAGRFVRGSAFNRHSRAFAADVERNVRSVREARRMADWVVFSVHNHEGGQSVDEPSDHIRDLAHAVIDAGADVVVGHGPHVDRGIEVYRDKPIVYSLGNFIMQNDQVELMPHDSMLLWGLGHEHSAADLFDARHATRHTPSSPTPGWWSAVVMVSFKQHSLAELRLHPIELGFGLSRAQAGRPVLAAGDIARLALERFRDLSAPFGTEVTIDGCVGVIRPTR
jgi:poly-gamma-glutamate capsule biosynthesis protein CapA/YwtB (metallophosphatase superfamily)